MILGRCHNVTYLRTFVYLAVPTAARYDLEGASKIEILEIILGPEVCTSRQEGYGDS